MPPGWRQLLLRQGFDEPDPRPDEAAELFQARGAQIGESQAVDYPPTRDNSVSIASNWPPSISITSTSRKKTCFEFGMDILTDTCIMNAGELSVFLSWRNSTSWQL
jgi:hypothetical protein